MPVAHAVYVPCSVYPSPAAAGVPAAYTIEVGPSPYDRIDQVRLTLPFDTSFSVSNVTPSTVSVNGIPCMGGTIVKKADNAIRVDIMLQQRLVKDQPITVVVKREAGIINPISPRSCYRMMFSFVRDGTEITWIESNQYAITPSALGSLSVAIDPPVVGAAGSYEIQFITGSNGRLKAGQDYVMVSFPAGFSLPQSFSMTDVTLNGVSCQGRVYRSSDEPNAIQIYAPVDVSAGSLASIRIPAKAGIKNPSSPGVAVLTVWTSIETTRIDAPPIVIVGRQVAQTALTLSPPVAGLPSDIAVQFSTSPVGRLLPGQRVMVRFPSSFHVPAMDSGATCLFNGAVTAVQSQDNIVSIAVPVYVGDSAPISISLPISLGIRNPSDVGGYVVELWTDADSSPAVIVASIQAPSASGAVLTVSTRAVGRVASWTVSFSPSSPERFPSAGESVSLLFDEHIIVPQTIAAGATTVNGIPAGVSVVGTAVTISVPEGVAHVERVTVVIDENAGVRTPPTPSQCGVLVSTTGDATSVATNAVDFRVLPVVTVVVTPDMPNGQNGYYIGVRPSAKLVGDAFSIYYRLDDSAYQLYLPGASLDLGEGSHTLSCYGVAQDGTQGDTVQRPFAVDLTAPKVLLSSSSGDILVNTTQVILRGTVSEPVDVLQFNGVAAHVATDLTFEASLSVSDGQALACFARDTAGNPTSSVRTIRVDSVPPVIARDGLQSASMSVHADKIDVMVTVNESATMTLNGLPMSLAGVAWRGTVLLVDGPNQIIVTALDRAGNESRLAWTVTRTDLLAIELHVGESTARVGDETRTLDAPPVIVNGVTFVPLRFIGEALGSEVQWNDALKVVMLQRSARRLQLTIGSKLAIVDGQIVELLEAPRIMNGRTMVPIRFISEAFGADVQWNPETQGISIVVNAD
jgi:hypothetical protein